MENEVKKTTLLSLIPLRVCGCCASCAKKVWNLRFFPFCILHIMLTVLCFVHKDKCKETQGFLLSDHLTGQSQRCPHLHDISNKTPVCPWSAEFSWSWSWAGLYCLLQKARWLVARPFVWPESALWGWRSPHLVQWARGLEEGEAHSAGHPNGTPGGGRRTWESEFEIWLKLCYVFWKHITVTEMCFKCATQLAFVLRIFG